MCRAEKSKGKPNGKKPVPEEKKLYLEPEYTKSRITDFEFKELVMLPREIDLNEWLASNSKEFPNSFESLVKKICKYLFHVLAHIYSSHFKETLALELHGHLNTLYTHFILFIREFNLVDPKETTIMDDLTEVLCSSSGSSSSNGSGNGSGGSGSSAAQNHVKER
ncbi:hypothetical protein lerEdw1_005305 [Lerista edwardsae]|nr:hypothetical protein lerEdw1_005305 [Lerista edwardsae]